MTVHPLHHETSPVKTRQRNPNKPSNRMTLRQARSMMKGLAFAREIGTPLNAHLTIHWGGAGACDDQDGSLFAHFRHILDKRLKRRNIPGGLTAIWVLERHRNQRTRRLSEVVHSHLLLHLPSHFERNPYREIFLGAVDTLVDRVGGGNFDDCTVELTFPKNPDGKYFLKGVTRAVWNRYNLPDKWRSKRGEGVIEGKRCGTTQNIGPAARRRWREQRREPVTWSA
jgi:hypothetical protein